MFRIALGLLALSLVAAWLGFSGVAVVATGFAKIVFVVALVLAIAGLALGGPTGPHGVTALVVLLILGAPALAQAQSASRYDTGVRDSATFGASVGFGHMGCRTTDGENCNGDGADEAGGLAVHVGFMAAPDVALIGDLWGMAHQEDRFTTSQAIFAGGLRVWATQRLWLQGGLGVARSQVDYDGALIDYQTKTDWEPAVVGAVGYELVSATAFALDLELRGGTGFYEDDVRIHNLSLGVGVSWY